MDFNARKLIRTQRTQYHSRWLDCVTLLSAPSYFLPPFQGKDLEFMINVTDVLTDPVMVRSTTVASYLSNSVCPHSHLPSILTSTGTVSSKKNDKLRGWGGVCITMSHCAESLFPVWFPSAWSLGHTGTIHICLYRYDVSAKSYQDFSFLKLLSA